MFVSKDVDAKVDSSVLLSVEVADVVTNVV